MRFELNKERLLLGSIGHTSGTSQAPLIVQLSSLIGDAISVLWAFYTRPLEGGVKWKVPGDAGSLAHFRAACADDLWYLVELCRDLRGHHALSASEAAVIDEIASVALLFDRHVPAHSGETGQAEISARGMHPGVRPTSENLGLSAIRADLRRGCTQQRIKMRAISATGVLILGGTPLSVGDYAAVGLRGGAWIQGKVAWAIDDRSGFAFADPEDPLVLFLQRLFAEEHFDG